jgi:uncharacterized protein (DUF3084 family)
MILAKVEQRSSRMMGPGGGVVLPTPTSGGLKQLTALVEIAKDPTKFQAALQQVADREAALNERKEQLDQQKAELTKKAKELDGRERDMAKRLQAEADQRAAAKVQHKERVLDEALAKFAELRSVLERFQAKSESFQAKAGEAEKAVSRFLAIAA